ncbi:MAG: DEAD/DEAH box helicase [Selenomonadaceae bacterium]|nr:DEAD/DEAH box helicase [Selenomonadaceae bacterium]
MAYTKLEIIFSKKSFYFDEVEIENLDDIEQKRFKNFQADKFSALYDLSFDEISKGESPSFRFLHFLAENFLEILTARPELEVARENISVTLDETDKTRLLYAVPFALGSENIDGEWLDEIFNQWTEIFRREISGHVGTIAKYLSGKRKDLKIAERVFFHLVEKKDDFEHPFAFLATYAAKDSDGKIRHMPLAHALQEFKDDRQKLILLLSCLNRAASVSPLINEFVDSGEMFHPLQLTTKETFEILKAVPLLEEQGILCRIPNWWKRRSASSIRLSVKFEQKSESLLGLNSIVQMQPKLTVDGIALTEEEISRLLTETAGLAQIKGKWIEVDKEKLQELLDKMNEIGGDISFLDALRLESHSKTLSDDSKENLVYTNGKWLEELMKKIRCPETIDKPKIPATVHADLRPYQKTGYSWLRTMADLKFGSCLADDMGLGKTLQVLTFLDDFRTRKKDAKILLIVPASLLGNWQKESEKFTPKIKLKILHGMKSKQLTEELQKEISFLTITTYTMAAKIEELQKISWDAVILDEAQAIKNSGTKQTHSIKKIPAEIRIALTGTPIENNLSNLWSLFDFLNKGLLGSEKEFKSYVNELEKNPQNYQYLRKMISPFILRRLKTDKTIISDLPEKLEQTNYIELSKKQIVLYRKQVSDLEKQIGDVDGISRKGLILGSITKLKQICNHPDQFLGLNSYKASESGKFETLREICETIYQKRERVLIFTQYKEITEYLTKFLKNIFHGEGLVLHGGTRIKERTKMVEQFNGEKYIPYMVLSVKAAGVGLNLTAANHVIHFDRWWNPAVENQATDRAFRIGQTKNVIVYKFVTRGTIEERIDELIEQKKSLAENVIGAGEQWITELSDKEIIDMMKLKI